MEEITFDFEAIDKMIEVIDNNFKIVDELTDVFNKAMGITL